MTQVQRVFMKKYMYGLSFHFILFYFIMMRYEKLKCLPGSAGKIT